MGSICGGGHVDEGEEYEQAAEREMFEEIGVKVSKLKRIGKCYIEAEYNNKIVKEFTVIYKANFNEDLKIDNNEVSGGKWFDLSTIDMMVDNDFKEFPDAFITVYKKYRDKLK